MGWTDTKTSLMKSMVFWGLFAFQLGTNVDAAERHSKHFKADEMSFGETLADMVWRFESSQPKKGWWREDGKVFIIDETELIKDWNGISLRLITNKLNEYGLDLSNLGAKDLTKAEFNALGRHVSKMKKIEVMMNCVSSVNFNKEAAENNFVEMIPRVNPAPATSTSSSAGSRRLISRFVKEFGEYTTVAEIKQTTNATFVLSFVAVIEWLQSQDDDEKPASIEAKRSAKGDFKYALVVSNEAALIELLKSAGIYDSEEAFDGKFYYHGGNKKGNLYFSPIIEAFGRELFRSNSNEYSHTDQELLDALSLLD